MLILRRGSMSRDCIQQQPILGSQWENPSLSCGSPSSLDAQPLGLPSGIACVAEPDILEQSRAKSLLQLEFLQMNILHSISSSGDVNRLYEVYRGFREEVYSTRLCPTGVSTADHTWAEGGSTVCLVDAGLTLGREEGLKVRSSSFQLQVSALMLLKASFCVVSLLRWAGLVLLFSRALLDLLCFKRVEWSLSTLPSMDFPLREDLLLRVILLNPLCSELFCPKSFWYGQHASDALEGQLLSLSLLSSSSMGSWTLESREGCLGRECPSLCLSWFLLCELKTEKSSMDRLLFLQSLMRTFSLNLTSWSSLCLSLILATYFLRLIWSCFRFTILICL